MKDSAMPIPTAAGFLFARRRMLRWRRSRCRTVLQFTVVLIILVFILQIALPPDSVLVLWLRFWSHKALAAVLPVPNDTSRLFRQPRFPVDLNTDAAFILKTGYGTRERIPTQLNALGLKLRGDNQGTALIVADFSSHYTGEGQDFHIYDMVATAMKHEALAGLQNVERLMKYRNMTKAINGDDDKGYATELSRELGWELDAMKFIPALELAWRKLPTKKWYLMLDDDTYIIRSSLELILGHVDPSRPTYLGNVIGDFKGRFAHGGSCIAISYAAMARLFGGYHGGRQHWRGSEAAVHAAYIDSLTETWGDRLVAHTFMKVGVYLDEDHARFFNGEPPFATKIRADRFCSPIVSFHHLGRPGQMAEVGKTFRDITSPVVWGQLLKVYGQPTLEEFREQPIRAGADHVGQTDEHTTTKRGVKSAEKCRTRCDGSGTCLAWTWEEATSSCHLAPWFIMGEKGMSREKRSTYSGLNVGRVQALQRKCGS